MNDELLTYMDADPSPLNALTGMHVDECDALDDRTVDAFDWNGKRYQVKEMAEISHATTAEVLAAYTQRFYAGTPCLTVNHYGDGRCYYIAARTEDAFLVDFLREILPVSPLAQVSEGASVTARFSDEKRYVFVHNPAHEPGQAVFESSMRDVLTGEELGKVCPVDALSIRVLTDA